MFFYSLTTNVFVLVFKTLIQKLNEFKKNITGSAYLLKILTDDLPKYR